MKYIHVVWNGPYSYDEASKKLNTPDDRGVYQIYGPHPVYGYDVLLYIGKTEDQTFAKRLRDHQKWSYKLSLDSQDAKNIKIYVGYLGGYDGMPEVEEWARQIALVEQLLIYTHWPAGNSSGIKDFKVDQPEQEFYDTHVLNWEQRRSLLPEVSAARWSDRFEGNEGYVVFRSSPSALDDQETPATAKNSNKSKMASFSTKGEVLNDECSVKITDKEILVEYESYDGGGLHQYRGKNSGDGHFKLTRVPKGGEATLHRFSPSSQILEGYWSEDGERGMWRIELAGE